MTMSDLDPVLRAWQEVRREQPASCAIQSDLAVAALNSPERLTRAALGHLLEERCERCEAGLLVLWAIENPPPAVVARLASYPKGSAFAAALGTHLGFAPEPVRPAWLSQARWAALGEQVGGWLAGALVPRLLDSGLATRALDPAALPARGFGAGVSIRPIVDRRDAVELRVDADELESELQGVPLLVVFQRLGGAVLATREFTPFEGVLAVEVEADADAITADDVDVLLIGARQAW